jgi:hypothetical protein
LIRYRQTAFRTTVIGLLVILAGSAARAADRPLVGVAALQGNSPRAMALTTFLENNLVSMIENTGVFRPVNPALLREELNKFGCTSERCLLGFARDAGLNLIIRGDFDDMNDFIVLSLRAYGIDLPYQNRVIYQYTVEIPMAGRYGPAEYNNIAEEHSVIFFAKLMARYRAPLYLEAGADNALKVKGGISGSYDLYRLEPAREESSLRGMRKIGTVHVSNGIIRKEGTYAQAGDFILTGFRDKADFLDNYSQERKRGLVFKKAAPIDTLYALLLTGPASATMPIIAPFVGYYPASDWQGLALWVFNATPYLYLEINGLVNYWSTYYKKKKTLPGEVQAQYYFGLYILCAGGMSLFVDAFSHSILEKASNYQGAQPFMGNPITAGYLELVSGGAGLFYRGHRIFGYLYYHANNLLLYFTIREFCPEKKFNKLTRTFFKDTVNKTRAYSLLSAACAVKIGGIVHAILVRDNIRNGKIIEEGYDIEPIFYVGSGADLNLGLQYSYRW